jgi:hypothetical protein
MRTALSNASVAAWDDLVEHCINKDAAFLVIAGGICGESGITLTARLRFRRGLKRLAEHGIRTFLALGPADAAIADCVPDVRPGEVVLLPSAAPLTVRVEHRGQPAAFISGQSAPAEGEYDCPGFLATATDDLPRVAVLPGGIADLECHSEQIRRKASYWALGAAPDPSRRGFSPWIVESGALQSRANHPAERGARGAMLVSADGDRVLAVDHVPLDRVRYAEITIAPTYALDDALLLHQVLDDLNRLRATNGGRALVVDTVVQSHTSLDWSTTSAQADHLLGRLRDETAAWDPLVWCSSLRVAAATQTAAHSAHPVAQGVLQKSRALLSNPLQRSYFFARHFDPLMRRCTSELDTGDAERLITTATELAVQHVVDDRPVRELR